MRKRWKLIAATVVAAILGSAVSLGIVTANADGKTVRFKAADLKVEANDTDGDAGLQVFLDHEPWKQISIARPDGTKLLDISAQGVLEDYGLTELFSESSEPPFTEFPLAEFKKLFPEGNYTFTGETIDGVKMRSRVPLTHDIPDGPKITAPSDGSTVPNGEVTVHWEPVTNQTIVAYQIVVTKEGPQRVLEATVPATAREFKIPSAFIEPGTDFKAEVLAIEKSSNQTLTEVAFTTE